MRIDERTDATSLRAFAGEAVRLLCAGDISTLASRFGYALAYGREPAAAIRTDLEDCLATLGAISLEPTQSTPTVKYFKQPDSAGLFAVVECLVPTNNGAKVLVELVVTGNEKVGKHISLEAFSAAES